MIRLFKCDEAGTPVAYHEAWIEPQHRRIVEHWGYLGEAGDTATHRIHIFGSLERQFTDVLRPARELGFTELPESAYATLIVAYDVTDKDRMDVEDTQEDVTDALNEKLGWIGLGYCEDGRITGTALEVCCRVLDVAQAEGVIAEALGGSVFAYYSRIYQE
jgi:hypothetical protein